jgi:hypothetical protein
MSYREGQTATNPKTGQKVVFKNGQWVSAQATAQARPQLDPQAFRRAQDSLSAIEDAKGRTNWLRTGWVGGMTAQIPGSPAFNLDRDLDTLKARTAFDELQAMRKASSTGGALGNVTEKELALLQAAEANLDVGQTEGQIDKNLDRLRGTVGSRMPGLTRDNPIPIKGPEDMVNVPEGAWLRTPDGSLIQRRRGKAKSEGGGWKVLSVE